MKRSNSEIFYRQEFPPLLFDEVTKYESEIGRHFNEKMKTDRRYIASIVCAVVVLFFLIVFSITIAFAIILALIGACFLGLAIGKSWKRQKLQKNAIAKEKFYLFRLGSIMLYLKSLKKTKISLDMFQGLLEKAFEEFLPALILQVHNPKLSKEVKSLVKFLKSNAVHACILNSAAHLELSISMKSNLPICAYRLRKFFIPVMNILKQPVGNENQELEVVIKILEILQKEETQMILLQYPISQDKAIKSLSDSIFITTCDTSSFPSCKLLSDIIMMSDPGQAAISPTLRLYRRNSCSELFPQECSANTKLIVSCLSKAVTKIKVLDDASEHNLNESHFEAKSPEKFIFNSPSKRSAFAFVAESPVPLLLKKSSKSLFEANDMEELERSEYESEESNEKEPKNIFEGSRKSLALFNSGENPENYVSGNSHAGKFQFDARESSNDSVIDVKVHPFIDCFDLLLSIENEQNTENSWRIVVDKPGTKVYQKKLDNTPLCMIKAFCDIKYPSKVVYQAIWDTETRTKWDAVFHEFRLIDQQEDYGVLYYMIKAPFGITRRDWLQRRTEIHDYPEPGTIILHYISMEHPAMPPKKGVIRAETIISGYIIRPTSENTCKVMIVSQNDIKGLIPAFLVNRFSVKAPVDWVNSLNRGCKLVAGY